MKNFSLFKITIIFLSVRFIHSCSQTSIKDDGLIEDPSGTNGTGVSTNYTSGSSSFIISSLSPLDRQTGESRTRATILIIFSNDVKLNNTSRSWTATWTTTLTSEGSCSVSYGSKLVHSLRDNYYSCPSENSSLSGKPITLNFIETLALLDNYKKKILKTSLEGTDSTQSSLRVQLSKEYTFYFKSNNYNFSFFRT